MNITELARRTHMPTHKLREIIPQLGFDVGMRAVKVDDRVAQDILKVLSSSAVREKFLTQDAAAEAEEEKNVPVTGGPLSISESITVRDFASALGVPVTKIIIHLMKNGIMAAQNERIDFETASIIAEDFGRIVVRSEQQDRSLVHIDRDLKAELQKQHATGNFQSRPPVVVVMGHVDHGKTTLLDALRHSQVAEGEAGRITQHIGAFQVMVHPKDDHSSPGRMITFIDTPGHEAFTAMRSRGARIADIAILVVAADDGVQSQTIEALSHIQRSSLPFIVAVNKIDREQANPEVVKKALAEVNVIPEAWGGSVPFVLVSALKGTGIPELLDIILLVADLKKQDIVADPTGAGVGTIIESHIDKGLGPVATLLVQNGTFSRGDWVIGDSAQGKIRSMRSDQDEELVQALPSTPVRLLGLKGVPAVGEVLEIADEKALKRLARSQKKQVSSSHGSSGSESMSLGSEKKKKNVKEVLVILKADVMGSIEALKEAIRPLNSDRVRVVVYYAGLGDISELDVERAAQSGSLLVGFNVASQLPVEIYAKEKGIVLVRSKVIYDLVDAIAAKTKEDVEPEIQVKEVGKARVLKLFSKKQRGQVIGCQVTGRIIRNQLWVHILRNLKTVGEGKVGELQVGKMQVAEVAEGAECGMYLETRDEVRVGDTLECYEKIEKK